MYRSQIEKIYAPLLTIWMKDGTDGFSISASVISKLFADNHAIVPLSLLQEWNEQERFKKPEYEKFEEILLANYNWTRKQLGYPYEKERINLEHVPHVDNAKMNVVIWMIYGLMLVLISIIYLLKESLAIAGTVDAMIIFGVGLLCILISCCLDWRHTKKQKK